MKKRLLVFFSFFLTASLVHAQSAEDLLERDLRSALRTLPRDTVMYNYFNMTQTPQEFMTPQGRASWLKRYFDYTVTRFWDPNIDQTSFINAGPGLYAAIDPLISKNFGNSMMELDVPAGTAYLALVHPIPIENDTQKALLNEGILNSPLSTELLVKAGSRYAFSRDTLKNMIKPAYASFRRLVQEIFVRNSIGMVEYNWNTSLDTFCRGHGYSAFVFTGLKKTGPDGRSYYEENINKILMYGVVLPELTPEEISGTARTLKFTELLQKMKAASGSRAKNDLIQSYYPDENEKNDLISKTFSCVN